MQILSILGRERQLCLAELESKFTQVKLIAADVAIVESSSKPDISQFGGSIKFGQVVSQVSIKDAPKDLASMLAELVISQLEDQSKATFAISAYGQVRPPTHSLRNLGINTKKLIRQSGRSARYVAAKDGAALSAAQLKYNQLATTGCELLVVWGKSELTIARTFGYQDIDSYSERDFGRPARDSKVGMLPPKLAQIMINLAKPRPSDTVYDPFCGNGVILQEAMLLGHGVVGSDNSPEMVDASQKNLDWFEAQYSTHQTYAVHLADATQITGLPDSSVVVTEGYLGTPIHEPLRSGQQDSIVRPTNDLYHSFLRNLHPLLKTGDRIAISFPTWIARGDLLHLPVIDQLGQMGYTTQQYSGQNTLVYRRENQFVGREIAVLIVT